MNIKVFSIPDCPYCSDLKNKLTDLKLPFEEVDVALDENEKEFDKLMGVTKSDSVPQVVVENYALAPNVNFHSIDQAVELVQRILTDKGLL